MGTFKQFKEDEDYKEVKCCANCSHCSYDDYISCNYCTCDDFLVELRDINLRRNNLELNKWISNHQVSEDHVCNRYKSP